MSLPPREHVTPAIGRVNDETDKISGASFGAGLRAKLWDPLRRVFKPRAAASPAIPALNGSRSPIVS